MPIRVRMLGLVCLVVGLVNCGGRPADSPSGELSRSTMDHLRHAVFEVVVPKSGDGTVGYTLPLPLDRLPYAQRVDRFDSIGTAFAISPTHFVTAAHVMPADRDSFQTKYLLRDASGATYEVGRIVKYSQYRDLCEVELVQPVPGVVPLDLRAGTAEIQVGDRVAAVGNALGQGVVVRTGALTSFTPEPLDGTWKDIRFSAPVSPGNSGGPLVDEQGRVVGVVVRVVPGEVLSFAVPIEQLSRLGSMSEFLRRDFVLQSARKAVAPEWRFASPLPATIGDLREAATHDLVMNERRWPLDFTARFGTRPFPQDPRAQSYFHEPYIPYGLSSYTADDQGVWSLPRTTYKEREVAGGFREHAFESATHTDGQLLLSPPESMPLATFFTRPRLLGESFLRNHPIAFTMLGETIRVASIGEPTATEPWTDEVERPWTTFVWRLPRFDQSLILSCLTGPSGWACRWNLVAYAAERLTRLALEDSASRISLSYEATLSRWDEYLGLSAFGRPKLFAGARVHLGNTLLLEMSPFSGNIDLPSLTAKSLLQVYPAIDPATLKSLRIVEARLVVERGKPLTFAATEILEPGLFTSDHHARAWADLGEHAHPYDDKVIVDKKGSSVSGALQGWHTDVKKRWTYACRNGPDDPPGELVGMCTRFLAGIHGRTVR